MKRIVILFLVLIGISGCETKEEPEYKKLMQEHEYILLDVRTKEEYDEEHIKGAILIPYDTIDENISLDSSKYIFVYCRSGNRSKIAYDKLVSYGYQVYDLGAMSQLDLEKE